MQTSINRIVTTSWDDGHKLDLRLVKLLRKYGLKGTLYISPFNREFKKKELLEDKDIKKISGNFIEIGAHTMTHPRLTQIPREQSLKEIKMSKMFLESLTGKAVISFCYPGGRFNSEIADQVKSVGFILGRTIKTYKLTNDSNPFNLPTSIHAYDHWTDILRVFKFVNFNPIYFFNYYRKWDKIAIKMFDDFYKHGGIYHLWGHSWEIEKDSDWGRLEKVFKYISGKKGIRYLTNGEIYA